MFVKEDVEQVREDLSAYVGLRVRLKANKGRKRYFEKEGIIQSTYPSIFVIQIEMEAQRPRMLSFSYTDVLTNSVQLFLCDEEKNICN